MRSRRSSDGFRGKGVRALQRGKTNIDYVKAWQCIGCGKIEAPQTCVGICQDRKVELVYAHEHREVIARMQAENNAMASLVRQLAWSTPREGEWERSYRALQERARHALTEASEAIAR